MYRIIDILANVIIAVFDTQEDLIRYWCVKCGNFDRAGRLDTGELNITGKDCLAFREPIPGQFFFLPACGYMQEYRTAYRLRRYQVVDEDGNPQDIREWTEAIEKVRDWYRTSPRPYYRGGYGNAVATTSSTISSSGAKHHCRRISGPAMYRSTQRHISSTEDLDEELTERYRITVPKSRDIWSKDDAYDKAERKFFSRYGQRSWKNTKARSQWAKHKSGASRRSIRYLRESDIGYIDDPQEGYAS